MPKPNRALLLLALLSLGAFYNLGERNESLSLKELDSALAELEQCLKEADSKNQDYSISDLIEQYVLEAKSELSEDIASLEKALKQEKVWFSNYENKIAIAKKDKHARHAQQIKGLMQAEAEKSLQKQYGLEKELKTKTLELKTLASHV